MKNALPAVFAALFLLPSAVFAALPSAPPPGERTIWDEIMKEQSRINLRKGYALMNAGDHAAAAAEFSRALAKAPSDPDAILLYGSSLYWLGEVDRAIGEYLRVIEMDPSNALAWQLKGIALAWKGDAEGALADFLKAQKLDPVRSDVKMNIGSVYHSLGLYGSALSYFRAAAASDPENPLYHYQLGLLYSRLGRNAEGKASLRTALRYFRSYEDAMLELAVLEERDGDLPAAVSLYRDALRIKPRDSVARLRLGLALLKQGKTGQLAGELEPAFLLSPRNEKGGISLSMAYAGGKSREDESGDGRILSSLRRLPEDEEVRVRLELIRLPRLETASSGAESLSGALARAVERPRLSYVKKEYAVAAGAPGRAARLEETAEEIERLIAAASAEGDVKVSLDIETIRPAVKTEARVVYEPRSVGNDMGLWVVGNNWLENVEEALAELHDLPQAAASPGAAALLRGLGFLLEGEHSLAAENFGAASGPYRRLSLLGLCVAAVQKGDEPAALELAKEALSEAPGSPVAKDNLRWLENAGKSPRGEDKPG
ncbi:MAG: tetratricopeptide repeat protein [Elusimicrobiales bacterium]|nr:tetratricopeptide repeat protein [Elusimicrobiales bacterium]